MKLRDVVKSRYTGTVIAGIGVVGLVVVLAVGFVALFNNNPRADAYAGFATGLATLVLVGVTIFYVNTSSELVDQAKKDREDRQDRRNKRQEALRKALKNEIESSVDLEEIEEQTPLIKSITEEWGPTEIYEQNVANLHLLSSDEIEHIVRYYSQLQKTEQYAGRLRHMQSLGEHPNEITTSDEKVVRKLREYQNRALDSIKRNIN